MIKLAAVTSMQITQLEGDNLNREQADRSPKPAVTRSMTGGITASEEKGTCFQNR